LLPSYDRNVERELLLAGSARQKASPERVLDKDPKRNARHRGTLLGTAQEVVI
jgi:hypothetical protein